MSRDIDGCDDGVRNSCIDFHGDAVGTMVMWIKQDVAGVKVPIGASTSCTTDDEIRIETRTSGTRLRYTFLANAAGQDQLQTPVGTWVAPTGWKTVVLSSNDTTIKIAIDGVDQTLSVLGGGNNGAWLVNATDADTFSIGNWRSVFAGPICGQMFRVAYFSTQLTDNQITAYHNGIPPMFLHGAGSIKVWWEMLDASSTEPDFTSKQFDGTVVGTTKGATNPPVEMMENYL